MPRARWVVVGCRGIRWGLAFGLGCGAVFGVGFGSPAWAGDRALFEATVKRVEQSYLRPDDLDPGRLLVEAAEGLEGAVPWLIVEADGPMSVRLRHGEAGAFGVVEVRDLTNLPQALEQVEDLVRGQGSTLPPGVSLPIELTVGMARALDRHSVILHGSGIERFDERLKGRLLGIGARIGSGDRGLEVKEVFPGGPAERGGLQVGDRVLRIDGVSTVGMGSTQSVKLLKGEEGSSVRLEIERPANLARPGGPGNQGAVANQGAAPMRFQLELARAEVVIPNVSWERLPDGILSVKIDHFSEQTVNLVRRAIRSVPGEELSGLVIDLRGNGGGSMVQACRVADLFLLDGPVLTTRGRGGEPVEGLLHEYLAQVDGDEPDVPVVLIMDEHSASASEILAGALVLRDRAVIVGSRSHGKGSVQKVFTIRPGDERSQVRLKLTVAEYLLPGEVPIDAGVGLAPDLWVRAVTLDGEGVRMPEPEPDVAGAVLFVKELPGWRQKGEDRGDIPLALAQSLIRRTADPSRDGLLEAVGAEVAETMPGESRRLSEALAARGLDWRVPEDMRTGLPISVQLGFAHTPKAGESAELRALVRNNGTSPLHQVLVRIEGGGEAVGADGLVLPIGYLPPGEEGLGSAWVRPPAAMSRKVVTVTGEVSAAGRDATSWVENDLVVEGRAAPQVGVTARYDLLPGGGRMWVELENLGAESLENLRLRVALPEDAPVELLEPEQTLVRLAAGARATLDVPVRPLDGATQIRAELRVYSDLWGRILAAPVELGMDGRPVQRRAPTVDGKVPAQAPAGPLGVQLDVRDDRRVRSMTAWLDGEKVAYRAGTGPRLSVPMQLQLGPGPHQLVVDVEDDDGMWSRRTWSIRSPGGEVAGGP